MNVYVLVELKEAIYDDRVYKTNLGVYVCHKVVNNEIQRLQKIADNFESYSWRTSYYAESVKFNKEEVIYA